MGPSASWSGGGIAFLGVEVYKRERIVGWCFPHDQRTLISWSMDRLQVHKTGHDFGGERFQAVVEEGESDRKLYGVYRRRHRRKTMT